MRTFARSCIFILLSMGTFSSYAQVSCGTPTLRKPVPVKPGDLHRSITEPEVLKIFIHVVAHSDGTYGETDMDSLAIHYDRMQQHFAPHGICFILAGMDVILNTDLDSQYVHYEESDLTPYLKPDMLNVFIHNYLADGGGTYGGYAYDIPNPYLSLWEAAVVDPNGLNTLAHEVGHCLGLYHTHEVVGGNENVDRIGICANCATVGDVLCDTPADPGLSLNGMMNGCTYIGTGTDVCGDPYVPEPQNIMSYAPGNCTNYFTTGQGDRAIYYLLNDSQLIPTVAPYDITFTGVGSWSSGEHFQLAENNVTLNSPDLAVLNSAQVTFGAGNAVTVYPGTTFSPASGFARLFAQEVCD